MVIDGERAKARASDLLSGLEAAEYLGITPELLFAYTSRRSWKSSVKKRCLKTEDVEGKTRFRRGELDDFDRHLGEPWGDPGSPRNDPPRCVENHLRAESGNQCLRCGSGIGVQTAHIEPWAKGRSNHHHNLVRICSQCHVEHDQHQSLSSDKLRTLKQEAVDRTRKKLRRRMHLIAGRFRRPAADRLFVGRETDVGTLRHALRSQRNVLLRGAGGIGKTQALLRALDGLDTGRPVVWVEVERYDSAEDLLTALQVLVTEGEEVSTDTLASRLDELNACMVLDGVEQLTGPSLDEVDDLLARLSDGAANAQFVATSQVDLPRTLFDERVDLAELGLETSRRLLRSLVDPVPLDTESEAAILVHADGHPLTLRLISAQIRHFGSARTWLRQMERQGPQAVELPKRSTQDRTTSLTHCLSLSYDELEEDERRLLYLIASCPGGIDSPILAFEDLGGADAPEMLAGLRRWSLVETTDIGQMAERSQVLSPVGLYARDRWRRENRAEAKDLQEALARNFALLANLLDSQFGAGVDGSRLLEVFLEELPNLLRVIAEAEARPRRRDLDDLAYVVCNSLSWFFFVVRLPEEGARVMLRGLAIARRDGEPGRVSGFILMALSQGQRSGDRRIPEEVESALDEIRTDDASVLGNLALARAMLAERRMDVEATEAHARAAIARYETVRDELGRRPATDLEEDEWEANGNDLSAAFHMLGVALIGRGAVREALAAYGHALEFLGSDSVAVNQGQVLYQIGLCHGLLNDYAEALAFCARAATRFHATGMQEYLSAAVSGVGYALLEVDDDTGRQHVLPPDVLRRGLIDAVATVERRLCDLASLHTGRWHRAVGYVFGVVVALSLSDDTSQLGPSADALRKLAQEAEAEGNGQIPVEDWQRELAGLDVLAGLMTAISDFERNVEAADRVRARDGQALREVCTALADGTQVSQWLDVYVRRKWSENV